MNTALSRRQIVKQCSAIRPVRDVALDHVYAGLGGKRSRQVVARLVGADHGMGPDQFDGDTPSNPPALPVTSATGGGFEVGS
jgi:hypothetical protein